MPLPLRVRGLRRQYPAPGWRGFLGEKRGGIRAFDVEVAEGECVALLGANGSGKTTALRCMAGLERADAGSLEIFGAHPFAPAARREIAYVPEVSPLAPEQSGRAFLEDLAALSGLSRRERRRVCAALLERFELQAHADRSTRGYSKGMLRRVVLAQAFLRPRRLLLFDEPTSGLDALGMLIWQELLEEARARGAAIVLSSHWSGESLAHCERAVVLEDGAVRRSAAIDELFADPEIHELVFRGLDEAQRAALCAEVERRGGSVVHAGARRREMREILRELLGR